MHYTNKEEISSARKLLECNVALLRITLHIKLRDYHVRFQWRGKNQMGRGMTKKNMGFEDHFLKLLLKIFHNNGRYCEF